MAWAAAGLLVLAAIRRGAGSRRRNTSWWLSVTPGPWAVLNTTCNLFSRIQPTAVIRRFMGPADHRDISHQGGGEAVPDAVRRQELDSRPQDRHAVVAEEHARGLRGDARLGEDLRGRSQPPIGLACR